VLVSELDSENLKAFLGTFDPLGNTLKLLGIISVPGNEIYPWDLHYTILTDHKLTLQTDRLDLGAIALLGIYF
jgi:hypothetical protein